MTSLLKAYALRSLTLKRLYLELVSRKQGYLPDWRNILSGERDFWDSALEAAKDGPNVLVATNTGGHIPSSTLEGLLAAALTIRGANVHVMLCDEALPACLLSTTGFYPDHRQFARYGPSRDTCKGCYPPASRMYRSFGLNTHCLSELLSPEDWKNAQAVSSSLPFADIAGYSMDGISVGEHAIAGALRFYARGNLDGQKYADPILRRYFKAAILTTYATRRLLDKINFECVVFNHGIYVPQGITGEVCRRMNIRVANWNPAYRKRCFIFSHDDTYHHTLMSEPVSKWENIDWTPGMEAELMNYLKSRWQGTNDWIWFHDRPEENLGHIARETGVDFSKPCIGMLTNVMWDAQLHYPANAFPSMLDWVLKTIDYFSKRPELQLLIRVHPAEIRGILPSQQLITDEIKKVFPALPNNVFVIPPESQVSTYAAMMACKAVIIYGTKTGVELASMGIPVIVAGEAWVRNKGITRDASSVEDYFRLLDQLPPERPMDEATIMRARKYAYHFFFRRMIPLEFMEPATGHSPYRLKLDRLRDLRVGHSRGLDIICDGILKGTDFIYPAESGLNHP